LVLLQSFLIDRIKNWAGQDFPELKFGEKLKKIQDLGGLEREVEAPIRGAGEYSPL